MGTNKKGVSFVIPAKNEEKSILITLETIQKYANNFDHEVIVVNHNSTDATKEVAESMGAKVLDKIGGTIGSARNFGVLQSSYQTIIFIDADISLTEQWQQEIESVLVRSSENSLFVTGSHCIPAQDGSWIERYWFSNFSQNVETTHLGTGHLIMSRSLFDLVHGFDESLKTGEDYDLCQRIRSVGGVLENNPELVVIHRDYPQNIIDFFQRERWHGRGDAQSFNHFFSSKVSLASLFHIIFHFIFILVAATKPDSLLVFFSGMSLFAIPFLAALYKFRSVGVRTFAANTFLFYIYFWARFLSIIK